jgi:hypothetical protein
MKRFLLFILMVSVVSFKAISQEQATPFTLSDRESIMKTQLEIESLQKEMNLRFEEMNKHFEDRFDDINKRIDQTNTYIGWLMSLFGAMTLATFGFAIWDRRTMVRPFETKVKVIESNYELEKTKLEKMLSSLRELAKTDSKLAEILKNQNLL